MAVRMSPDIPLTELNMTSLLYELFNPVCHGEIAKKQFPKCWGLKNNLAHHIPEFFDLYGFITVYTNS